jgi:hypothetical protein
MCLESWKRFRCGCIQYDTVSQCPHLDEANSLIDNHDLREDDPRIDKLHEKCDGASAKRYLAQFTKCARCLADMAAAAAGGAGRVEKAVVGTGARDVDMDDRMDELEQVVRRKR